jgi:hypothetical protein
MLKFVVSLFWWLSAFLRFRNSLGLEIVASRQQISVLKRKNPRPRLSPWDQLFWVFLRRVWSPWAEVLVIVKPERVVRWHRAGFGSIGGFFPGGGKRADPGLAPSFVNLSNGWPRRIPAGEVPGFMENS